MKKILLQVPTGVFGNNKIFAEDINNQTYAYRELKRRLFDFGYNLITADNNTLDNCEWIFFLDSMSVDGLNVSGGGIKASIKNFFGIKTPRDWPNRPLYQEAIKIGMRDNLVLFLLEGKAVNPHNYKKELWDKFKYIFTWDDELVDNKKFFKFFLPAPPQHPPIHDFSFSEKKLLTNMSTNRHSSDKNELYSERRKTIDYFDKNYPHDFDLYGFKWNQPVTRAQKMFPWLVKKYKTYKGISEDKIGTLSRYKFTLSYENLKKTNGYVSEKMFDTISAHSVPVYWGSNDIANYVDPKVFVDRRKFKNNEELANFLKNMSQQEHVEMLMAGQRYLNSEAFKPFLPSSFCENIIKKLGIKKRI